MKYSTECTFFVFWYNYPGERNMTRRLKIWQIMFIVFSCLD